MDDFLAVNVMTDGTVIPGCWHFVPGFATTPINWPSLGIKNDYDTNDFEMNPELVSKMRQTGLIK